jgi:hypothetical protein
VRWNHHRVTSRKLLTAWRCIFHFFRQLNSFQICSLLVLRPQKENFVKCDWPTQIFRRKKILNLKIFNFEQWYFRKIFCPWKTFLSGNGPLLSLPTLAQTARVYILLTVWRALCKLHLIHSHINIRFPLWFCYILNHATLLSEQWQRVIQSCEQ